MSRRWSRAITAVLITLIPLGVAAPAGANVTGNCRTGQNFAVIDGVRYTPSNDTPINPVLVPNRSGVMIPYRGKTTVPIMEHSGWLQIPIGPVPVEVAPWSHPNTGGALGANGTYDLDRLYSRLPLDIVGLVRVNGHHQGKGGGCDGFALLRFEGNPLATLIGASAIGALAPLLFLMLFAGFVGSRLLGATGGLLFGLAAAVSLQQYGLGLLDNFAIFGLGLLFFEFGKWMGSARPFGRPPVSGPLPQGQEWEHAWGELPSWTRSRLRLGFLGGKDPQVARLVGGLHPSGLSFLWFGLFALLLAGGLGITRHLEYGFGAALGYAVRDPFTWIVFGMLGLLFPLLRVRALHRWQSA